MATDRSLATLLRALGSPPSSGEDAARLLNTAATLLSLLTNPLNVTLLTTHLVTAPAVWSLPSEGLTIALRVLTTFQAASAQVQAREDARYRAGSQTVVHGLPTEEWARAVVEGANENCEQWKHVLVLGGLLTGLEAHDGARLGRRLRAELESAVVAATNLALHDAATEASGELAEHTLCVVLSLCFDRLQEHEKLKIEAEKLLTLLPAAMFFSREGLHYGYFLGIMDQEVIQAAQKRFTWPARSPSFRFVQSMATGPVLSALGPLSRLTAFCLDRAHNAQIIHGVSEDIATFCRSLGVQWRQNKLSEVAEAEENLFLTDATRESTLPLLWQTLKSSLFCVILVQHAIMSQVLGRLTFGQSQALASQTLHSLRNLYFIISRLGHGSLSQFTFVHMSAIDVIARHSRKSEDFLREIRPREAGRIPSHPYERCLDLYFLNTAEHLAPSVHPTISEELIMGAAMPYLVADGDVRLQELFEAAHSTVLSVFSVPLNSAITTKHLPFYIETLFQAFPRTLSPRQFRLAVRTVVSLVSPPSPISVTDPLLASTVLELLRYRSSIAATGPIFTEAGERLTEQVVLVLALLDCLPALSPLSLKEWLPMAAELVDQVADEELAQLCRSQLWDVVSGDAMDGEKGDVAAYWWTTEGGHSRVFDDSKTQMSTSKDTMMSGALGEVGRL